MERYPALKRLSSFCPENKGALWAALCGSVILNSSSGRKRGAESRDRLGSWLFRKRVRLKPVPWSHDIAGGAGLWGASLGEKKAQERNLVIDTFNIGRGLYKFFNFFLKKLYSWEILSSKENKQRRHKGKFCLCAVGNAINAFPVRCNHCTQQIQTQTFQEKHEPANSLCG